MNTLNKICATCDAFHASEKKCTLNPVHVPVDENHFCRQWANADAPKTFGSPLKLKERDLYEYVISEETVPGWTGTELISAAAVKFNVSTRTVYEKLRKLETMGMMRRAKGEFELQGTLFWLPVLEERDGQEQVRQWPDEFDKATSPLFVERRKYDWLHVAPAFPHDGSGIKYSELAKKSASMGRGAFNRVLQDAIKANRIERRTDGLYYRK